MLSAAFWQQNMSCLLQAVEFSHSLLHFCKASQVSWTLAVSRIAR